MLLPFIAAAALALHGARPALAQDALVLSGGGARGLAHVGVLLHLEQLGYDPAIVIGNSMGAVVGALYAAGYNAEQIRARTLAIRWAEMFDPTPIRLGPDRELRLPMATFGLDVPDRRVSRGLFGEWRINRALVQLLFDASARARGDFDRLARRFRAITADLETGDKVVLASGDLARATRASMAYPGAFAPIDWDGRTLVDGGIVDNLPTIEARRLGAARIVAVDVSRPADALMSLAPLRVAQRSLDLMQRRLHPDPNPLDILIRPVAERGLLGLSFPDDPTELIRLGQDSAQRQLPLLRWERGTGSRPRHPPPARFMSLRIEAADSALAALARNVFASLARGPYDADAVLAAVDRLYGTGMFDGVWPRVAAPVDGDDVVLVVRLDAPPPVSVSIAAGFDTDRGGRAWAALERHVVARHQPTVLTAAMSTNAIDRWAALSARFQPTTRPGFAWSVGTHLSEHSVRTFAEDTRSTVEIVRAGGWLAVELPHVLQRRIITFAARTEWLDPEDSPGGWSAGPLIRMASPQSAMVVGTPVMLEIEARWGGRPYRRAAAAAALTGSTPALQAAAIADFRATSSRTPADELPALGDQHAIPGLRWGERRGRARAVVGADIAVPTPLGAFARMRLRTGTVVDDPARWESSRWITGAEIGAVWRVPFGTLEAAYGHATRGDGRFDVSVGRNF